MNVNMTNMDYMLYYNGGRSQTKVTLSRTQWTSVKEDTNTFVSLKTMHRFMEKKIKGAICQPSLSIIWKMGIKMVHVAKSQVLGKVKFMFRNSRLPSNIMQLRLSVVQ